MQQGHAAEILAEKLFLSVAAEVKLRSSGKRFSNPSNLVVGVSQAWRRNSIARRGCRHRRRIAEGD
jgi:hypothetical protein